MRFRKWLSRCGTYSWLRWFLCICCSALVYIGVMNLMIGVVRSPKDSSASNCLGLCDKSMFGMCVAGHVGRFAVCQFGHRVSNGPLWVLTNTVCAYASRVHKVDAQAFVDDLMKALRVIAHGLCKGIAGGCPVCLAALEIALQKMAFLD